MEDFQGKFRGKVYEISCLSEGTNEVVVMPNIDGACDTCLEGVMMRILGIEFNTTQIMVDFPNAAISHAILPHRLMLS